MKLQQKTASPAGGPAGHVPPVRPMSARNVHQQSSAAEGLKSGGAEVRPAAEGLVAEDELVDDQGNQADQQMGNGGDEEGRCGYMYGWPP